MLSHNEQTYKELLSYADKGMPCCVVNPCGSAKSRIALSYIKDHEDKRVILFTKQKNAKGYYKSLDDTFSDIGIYTYMQLQRDFDKKRPEILRDNKYKADVYIFDEAHYMGAPKWSETIRYMVGLYHPLMIGLTATPQRMAQQGTDESIVTDWFNGNSAGNYTSEELQTSGVFVEPKYVLSLWHLDEIMEEKKAEVMDSDLKSDTKESIFRQMDKELVRWKESECPGAVLQSTLPEFLYKPACNRILVYCDTTDNIPGIQKELDKMIQDITNKPVKSYIYTYRENESVYADFMKEDDTYIKILYSINKITETIHIPDLSVAIMLRPTKSNRIITQQFGRLNDIHKSHRPIIYDMVGNLERLNSILHTGETRPEQNKPTGIVSKKHIHIDFSHISSVISLFKRIDKAVGRSGKYTYKDFTGSLSQICNVYGKDYREIRRLVKDEGLPVDVAMERVKAHAKYYHPKTKYLEKKNPLTDEERAEVDACMSIVNNYITRHQITDEDLKQDLYMTMMETIQDNLGEGYARHKVSTKLQRVHTNFFREKHVEEEIRMHDVRDVDRMIQEDTLCEDLVIRDTLPAIQRAMKDLTPREKRVIELRYGLLDGSERTLEEVAKEFDVTRERIRQIEARALRKLRHPFRFRHIKGNLASYDDINSNAVTSLPREALRLSPKI